MAITTTGNIKERLKLGVKAIMYNEPVPQSVWGKIYTKEISTLAVEQELEMKMFGPAQIKAEGQPGATADNMSVATITYFRNQSLSYQFPVTREAEEDDQYGGLIKSGTKSLIQSFEYAKEQLGASLFNNAIDANSPLADGQPLLSIAHPLSNGETYSNTLSVAADLAEGSLEQLCTGLYFFKDHAGNLMTVTPQALLIPPKQRFAAARLLYSDYQANTNNNAINAIKYLGLFPKGFVINPHILAQNAWFVLTDSPGLKMYQKTKFDLDVRKDELTEIHYVKAFERYCFGCSNPRSVAGSFAF